MDSQPILQPDVDLLSSIFRGEKGAEFTELSRLAELVGVDLSLLSNDDRRDGVLRFSSDGLAQGQVRAQFHPLFAPYFAQGSVTLHITNDSARILELFAAVGSTIRGKVVGIVGAHGGAGASTLASGLARGLAQGKGSVALIDLCPASAGIELLLSLVGVPGKRWADVHGQGALLAGRLKESLPVWNGVRVLSADERGAAPEQGELPIRAVAALAQVNTWTILDMPNTALIPSAAAHDLLAWCDYLLVVTRPDSLHLIVTHTLLSHADIKVRTGVVAADVRSKNQAAHIAQTLNLPSIHTIRFERSYDAALEHGVDPGGRARTGFARDVKTLCSYIEANVEE